MFQRSWGVGSVGICRVEPSTMFVGMRTAPLVLARAEGRLRQVRAGSVAMSGGSRGEQRADNQKVVFVGNMPWVMDSYGLRKIFEPHGEVSPALLHGSLELGRAPPSLLCLETGRGRSTGQSHLPAISFLGPAGLHNYRRQIAVRVAAQER